MSLTVGANPSTQTLRPGDILRIYCSVVGPPPYSIKWSKVNGALSASAVEEDGFLEVVSVTASDGGHYRCRATNDAGYSDAFAEVVILGKTVFSGFTVYNSDN